MTLRINKVNKILKNTRRRLASDQIEGLGQRFTETYVQLDSDGESVTPESYPHSSMVEVMEDLKKGNSKWVISIWNESALKNLTWIYFPDNKWVEEEGEESDLKIICTNPLIIKATSDTVIEAIDMILDMLEEE